MPRRDRADSAVRKTPAQKKPAVKRTAVKRSAGEASAGAKKAAGTAKGSAAAGIAQRTAELVLCLDRLFPDPKCELDHRSPFELIIAVILSAQCTDKRVNMVTPVLFGRYPTPEALAAADLSDIERIIHSTGFFRNKAKNIVLCAQSLVKNFGGRVPPAMNDLLSLAGVARKTANVVLGECFGIAEGVVVDTHVTRLANLLGLTRSDDPKAIEKDLMAIVPRDRWIRFSHQLILHGRRTCIANRPRCAECGLADLCPAAKL